MEQLRNDQPERDMWISLIAGKDAVQLFRLDAKNPHSSRSNRRSSLIPLGLHAHNLGSALLWRWLTTPLRVSLYKLLSVLPFGYLPDSLRALEVSYEHTHARLPIYTFSLVVLPGRP